jgi:hypothetical protein
MVSNCFALPIPSPSEIRCFNGCGEGKLVIRVLDDYFFLREGVGCRNRLPNGSGISEKTGRQARIFSGKCYVTGNWTVINFTGNIRLR